MVTTVVIAAVSVLSALLLWTSKGWAVLIHVISKLVYAVGQIGSCAHDVYELLTSRRKRKRWEDTLCSLKEFMGKSGIVDELLQGTDDPILLKLALLSKIQKLLPQSRSKECELLIQSECEIPPIAEAAHYMNLSTAVYGASMVTSVRIALGKDVSVAKSFEDVSMMHAGISPEDVIDADVDFGGSLDYLRHALVVDHQKQAVVLAIRGTYSLSEIFTDVEGYTVPFCGGQAHAGIVRMTLAMWKKSAAIVRKAMQDSPYSDLVVTGHSLGAGAACLITVMLYHDKSLLPPNVKVRCMAYAPPPCFYPLEAAMEAKANTVAYVHNTDWIPSLSGHNIRRLFACLKALEDANTHLSWLKKRRIYYGLVDPPQRLIESVELARSKALPNIDGLPPGAIPARAVVILERDARNGSYTPAVCDPLAYSNYGIYVDINMTADHKAPKYEVCFDWLLKHSSE